MGTSALRERNKARTREDLAVAALTLFESQGYDATTCEEIAAAAGTSVRTFFRYFDTKGDVLFAGRSVESGPQAALAELRDLPLSVDPVEAVRRALKHPIDVLESRRDLVVRQFRVILTTSSLQTLRREQFHQLEDPFAAAVAARLGAHGDDLGPRWLAAAAASALRISIERWVTAGAEAGALAPLLDEALELVRNGFHAGGLPT